MEINLIFSLYIYARIVIFISYNINDILPAT